MTAIIRMSYRAVGDRARFLAGGVLLVFALVWASWFYPFHDWLDRQGTPLGADFSMFYVAGRVAASDNVGRLYDQALHQHELQQLFPGLSEDFCLPYRYPPQVAAICALLARLPYPIAYAVFFGASLAAWLAALYLLRRQLGLSNEPASSTVMLSLVAWPVALETLMGGQASMFAVAIVAVSLSLLRSERPIAAGCMLALAAYKPNVLGLFILGLSIRYPRVWLGIAPVTALLAAGAWLWDGGELLGQYMTLVLQLNAGPWDVETPHWKVHGLAAWLDLIAPTHGRMMATAFGVVASLGIGAWWRTRPATDPSCFSRGAAALLVVNASLNPYTPIYDLVLLAPVVLLAWDVMRKQDHDQGLLPPLQLQLTWGALFFGPHLSQALAKGLGVQCFPLVLVLLSACLLIPRSQRAHPVATDLALSSS